MTMRSRCWTRRPTGVFVGGGQAVTPASSGRTGRDAGVGIELNAVNGGGGGVAAGSTDLTGTCSLKTSELHSTFV